MSGTGGNILLVHGLRYTFRSYCDVQRFADHQRVGNGITVVKASVDANLNRFGTVHRSVFDATLNHFADDVVSGVITFTPNADMGTASLDAQILASCNYAALSYDVPRFTYHSSPLSPWPPIVIDPSSVQQTNGNETLTPNASQDAAGQATSVLNTIASSDPERDGHSRAALAISDSLSLPPWVGPVAIGVGIVGALVALGYAARNVARLRYGK